MRHFTAILFLGVAVPAQSACYENAATVEATDRTPSGAAMLAFGVAGAALASVAGKPNGSDRERYAANLVGKLPPDRLEGVVGCGLGVRLVGVKLDFDGAASRLTHIYEVSGPAGRETVTFGEPVRATLFPIKPREQFKMVNNKYVDVTPPMPTREQIEDHFTAEYLAALDRMAQRLAKKYPG